MLFLNISLKAQSYYDCSHRTIFVFNEATEDLDYLNDYEEEAQFKIDKDEKWFTLTTPRDTALYFVTSREYKRRKRKIVYEVMAPSGGIEYYCFDKKREEIKVLTEHEDKVLVLVFPIKKYWTEKD